MERSNLILYVVFAGLAAFGAFSIAYKTSASRPTILAHVVFIAVMMFMHTSTMNNLRFLLKVLCCDGIPHVGGRQNRYQFVSGGGTG